MRVGKLIHFRTSIAANSVNLFRNNFRSLLWTNKIMSKNITPTSASRNSCRSSSSRRSNICGSKSGCNTTADTVQKLETTASVQVASASNATTTVQGLGISCSTVATAAARATVQGQNSCHSTVAIASDATAQYRDWASAAVQ